MEERLRCIMVGVPAFTGAGCKWPPTNRGHPPSPSSLPSHPFPNQRLWSWNSQVLMKWTGEAPLISKSADWSGKENSWAEHGGVCTVITLLWKCVNECVCVCLVYPEPHWLIKQTRQSLQYLTCILLSRGSSDFCLYFTLMFSLTLTYGGVFKRNLIFFFFRFCILSTVLSDCLSDIYVSNEICSWQDICSLSSLHMF